jgi:hypothetical protein
MRPMISKIFPRVVYILKNKMFPFRIYMSCNWQIYHFYKSKHYVWHHTHIVVQDVLHMGSESYCKVRGCIPVWLCMGFRTAKDTITIICTRLHFLSYCMFYGPAASHLLFTLKLSRGLLSGVNAPAYVKRNMNWRWRHFYSSENMHTGAKTQICKDVP